MNQESIDSARALLRAAGVLYHNGDADDEDWGERDTINFNDTWCWASAWGERIPEDELPEVARLFGEYGWCGLLYWMSERHEKMRSEFHDVNRFVDFVRAEEEIRKAVPGSSARAYHKASYTLGAESSQKCSG